MESSIKPKTKLDHVDQASTCVVYKGKDTDIKKQVNNGTQQLLDLDPSSTKAGVDVIEQFRKDSQDDHLTEIFISKCDKIDNSKTNSFCEDRSSNSTDDQKADVGLKGSTSKDNKSKTGLDHEDQCSTRTVDQKADNLKIIASKDTHESEADSVHDNQSNSSDDKKVDDDLKGAISRGTKSEADSVYDNQSSSSHDDKKADDLIGATSTVTKSEVVSVHDDQSTSSEDDKNAGDDLKGTTRKNTQSNIDACSTSSALITISKDTQSSDSSQKDESSSSIKSQKTDDDLKGSTVETQSKSNEVLDVPCSSRKVDKKADHLPVENTDSNQDDQGSGSIVDKNSYVTKPASTVKLKIKTVSDHAQASTSMSQKKADFINSTIKHSQQCAGKDEVYEINFGLCPYPSPMLSVPINSRGSFKGEKNDSLLAQPVTPINYNNEIPNTVVNQQSNSKNVPNNMNSIEKAQEKHSDVFLEQIKKKREFIRHSLFNESDDAKEMLKVSTSKTAGKKDRIEVIYGQDSTRNETCCGHCGQTHRSLQPSREILKRMIRDHNLNFKIPLVFNMLDHTDSLGEINPDTNCCTFPGKNVTSEELLVYMKLKSEVLKDLRSSFDHAVRRNSLNNSSHPGTPNQEQNQNVLYINEESQKSNSSKRVQDKNT